MMTTAPRAWPASARARSTGGALVRCVGAVLVVTVLLLVPIALLGGSRPTLSAAVGAAIGLVVMAFGTLTMNVVAAVMPAASLSLALMTYSFQLAVTLALLAGLTRSGALDETLDRRWLGISLIVVVIVWMATHVVMVATSRLPVYDLDGPPVDGGAR